MKVKVGPVLFVLLVLLSLFMLAFAPMQSPFHRQDGGGDLSEGQLMIVGLIASAALWVLRILASRGYKPTKEIVAIGLYVVSFFAAILFSPLTFPPFPPFVDAPTFITALLTYIGALLALASPVVGMAFLIYNVLLKRVLEYVFPAAKG